MEDGLLNCTDFIVWPKCMHPRLLRLSHDLNRHVGKHKVGWLIRKVAWWPRMFKDIEEHCKSCFQCQQTSRTGQVKAFLEEVKVVLATFRHIAVHILAPFPRSKRGLPILFDIFSRLGLSKTIATDRSSQLCAVIMDAMFQWLDVKYFTSVRYHTQANGVVECSHGTLTPII